MAVAVERLTADEYLARDDPRRTELVDGLVIVVNPGIRPVTASLLVLTAGDTKGPPSEPERAVDAGRFAKFDLAALDAGGDHVLVVTSERPVAVGVVYAGTDGVSIVAAVPDYGYGTR